MSVPFKEKKNPLSKTHTVLAPHPLSLSLFFCFFLAALRSY